MTISTMNEADAAVVARMLDEDDFNQPSDPEEYNVEDIREERINNRTGALEYFVKWEGYPESDNTWEPSEHLKCPDIIAKYKEKVKEKRKRKCPGDLNEKKLSKTNDSTTQEEVVELIEDAENESNKADEPIVEQAANNAEPAASSAEGREVTETIALFCDDTAEQNLYSLVRCTGTTEFELVDLKEIEEKYPHCLLKWYKDKQLHLHKMSTPCTPIPTESPDKEAN